MNLLLALLILASPTDRDGDGLSDFEETHKYFTDPAKADSDGDGKPDGDWSERREYTYSVRSIVRVLRPAAAISDDYQDARVLEEHDDYLELEVIHYPLNTVADAIEGGQLEHGAMREYLASTTTSNWDEAMRKQLLAELEWTGGDDRQLVEKASAHLMKRAKYLGKPFTTFFVHFPDGKAATLPGLEQAVARNSLEGMPLEDQWQRELFAKGMFTHRTHGSCTSSAIYLAGGLRSLGIPTRLILTIPVVDASDPLEMQMVRALKNRKIRGTILTALNRAGSSWSSHTYNEVWVGGRWRRLNYAQLGQNILDARFFGLMTHILTVRDWADANAAATVGRRQGTSKRDDAFGYANPYSTVALTDRFGKHARIAVPESHKRLTITDLIWYDSDRRPSGISMNLGEGSGHLLFKVKENSAGEDHTQYRPFYSKAGKSFLLEAEGQEDVDANAERGFWGNGWFYLRIPPEELAKMAESVAYSLRPVDDAWRVADGVKLTRPESLKRLTVIDALWSDSEKLPPTGRMMFHNRPELHLLLRIAEPDRWSRVKRFVQGSAHSLQLVAEGVPELDLLVSPQGFSSRDGTWLIVPVVPRARENLQRGVRYAIRFRDPEAWGVREGLSILRP